MSKLMNDCLLRAIWRKPVPHTPIWIMRQAGRYLPEYRALRQKAGSFLNLCKNPEWACEVTLQPLARFPLDAAILFSDILTIPDAMGLGLSFKEGEGPHFAKPLQHERDIHALPIPEPETQLTYVLDTIRLIQIELKNSVPLIGFCGSPWTLATYMLEGKANKSFPASRALLEKQPGLLHLLLDKLATAVTLHLNAQIRAGVQVIMVFDTWGGMLKDDDYQAFSLFYIKKIIENVIKNYQDEPIPFILFTKTGGKWLELMASSGCNVVAVDWQTNLQVARKITEGKVALQGNMDPQILYQTPEEIRMEAKRIIEEFGAGSGHIFNLGHGIPQDVPPENVAVLVEAVHTLSREFQAKSSGI